MATTIAGKCNKCGATGTINLDVNVGTMNVGGKITVNQPCPLCEGELEVPSGRYKTNQNGVLVRVGDYNPGA